MKTTALPSMFERFFKRRKRDPLADAAPSAEPSRRAESRKEEGPEDDPLTPEERCGIEPGMPRDEVRAQLAKLFRRYNRLASSLESESREEAEYMLELIVQMREKYLG